MFGQSHSRTCRANALIKCAYLLLPVMFFERKFTFMLLFQVIRFNAKNYIPGSRPEKIVEATHTADEARQIAQAMNHVYADKVFDIRPVVV